MKCAMCGTKEKELRGVKYRGEDAGSYCHSCFILGSPTKKGFLKWEDCPVTDSTDGKPE